MNGRISESDVLSKVTPRALRAYVEAHGWRKVEPYGDVADVYAFGSDSPEILVPMSSRFADYTLRLWQMVTVLADTEEREREDILRDLTLADLDQVRVRVTDSHADGSIPIEAGVVLVQQSWNMLVAAARSAWQPRPAFNGPLSKKSRKYLKSVRLGQTEQGSFVINLLCPSDEEIHRVMLDKLVSGLRATRYAVDRAEGLAQFWLSTEQIDSGVSANLCEAVGGMLGAEIDSGIDVSVRWALIGSRAKEKVGIQFDKSHAPVLEEASRVLRRELREQPHKRIKGYVNSLARQQSDRRGRVSIKGRVNGSSTSVRVDFGPEDYHRVVDAHDRRRMISLEGDLMREGRQWTLANPRSLVILEDG